MKVFQTAKNAFSRLVEKRQGVFVSRPILNAEEWHAWAEKWKIPAPVPAAEMHVTVVYSPTVDVKMKPNTQPLVVPMDRACFAMFGPENDALVVAFYDYWLIDRHYAYLQNGAVSSWPTYRPHMTLSYGAPNFEISDEAIADAPDYIVLGAEMSATPKAELETADEADPEGVEADDGMDALVVVIEVEMSAAKTLLESDSFAGDPVDRCALRDIAAGRKISKGVAKRVAQADWATDALKTMGDRVDTPVEPKPAAVASETTKSMDVVFTMKDFPADVKKSVKDRPVFKSDDAERIIYGIASVSTVDGEMIEDFHGAKITTKCLREFTHDLVRNQRAGKFEHEGEVCNEIVEAFVLSDDIQRSLGISLGYEPLLIGMHVPGDTDWQAVCEGDWMFSIAGTLYYVEEGAQNAEAA